MPLKIAGGLYKGLPLETPSGSKTRPTAEVLRMAVFNICQHKTKDAHFLDLYAGSGAMGVEALSRGALKATFIENDRQALKALKKNIEKIQAEDASLVLPLDVQVGLKKVQNTLFNIVYIDPPYGEKKLEALSEKIVESLLITLDTGSFLHLDAYVFLEFSSYSKKDFSSLPLQHLRCDNIKTFGRSILYVFKYT